LSPINATKFKQEVVDTIKFQKDARAAYEKFGPDAKSVEGLEQDITKTLEKKYGQIWDGWVYKLFGDDHTVLTVTGQTAFPD
jgi:hypothetical protein